MNCAMLLLTKMYPSIHVTVTTVPYSTSSVLRLLFFTIGNSEQNIAETFYFNSLEI